MSTEVKPSEQFQSPAETLAAFAGLELLGKSAAGNGIFGRRFPSSTGGARGRAATEGMQASHGNGERVLFLGGVHGNETEGIAATAGFYKEFIEQGAERSSNTDLFFIPVLNPDGLLNFSRHNGNGVDLNRNMPTKDWQANAKGEKYYSGPAAGSEPETILLMKILHEFDPQFIVSLHSWKPMFNVNGPARNYAERMQSALQYEITEDIGYPTPGSLGTFSGWERGIPTITFEIERGLPLKDVYATVRGALLAVV